MEDREVQNDFSGTADRVVQAGSIHGDVNFHVTRRLPRPDQMPAEPTTFVNRSEALHRLSTWCNLAQTSTDSSRVTTVTGSPGVGKTALAVRWCHEAKDMFTDGNLYVDLRGYGSALPVTAAQALDGMLRTLDVPAERIPEDLDERAGLFRTLTGGRSMLFLLDNASSSEQVRRLIPSSPRSFVVITSRNRLRGLASREGAVRLDLDVLTRADAIELMDRLVGSDRLSAEPEAAGRIAQMCGFLPLTLRVVAERISSRPQETLASIVEELVGEQDRLDAVASAEDELSDTRAVFSWSYRKLPSELASAFRRLGLHPTKDIGIQAAAVLIGKPVPTTRRLLRELSDVHLITEEHHRFSMHDLLFSYARECVREEAQDVRTRAVRQCLAWYLHAADSCRRAVLPHSLEFPLVPAPDVAPPDFGDARAASLWFERERLNLSSAIRAAYDIGQYDICWKLASVCSSLFEVQCLWDEWRDNHRIGLEAAQVIGDRLGEAAHNALLGDVAVHASLYDEAEQRYLAALTLARRIPLPWLEGFMHRGLGRVSESRADLTTAEARYLQAREAFRRAGHGRGEAMSTMSLGNLSRTTGDLDRAVRFCAEAVQLLDRLGDSWSAALARLSLAPALWDNGDPESAIREWTSAAATFADFEDKAGEASASVELGDIHRSRGEFALAVQRWSRAAYLFEILKDPRSDELRVRLTRMASEEPESGFRD